MVHIKVFTCQASHIACHRAIHLRAWCRYQWAQPSHSSGEIALWSVYLTKWISGSRHLLPIIQNNLDFLVMGGDVAWQSNYHCYLSSTIYTRLKTACPHLLIMELRSLLSGSKSKSILWQYVPFFCIGILLNHTWQETSTDGLILYRFLQESWNAQLELYHLLYKLPLSTSVITLIQSVVSDMKASPFQYSFTLPWPHCAYSSHEAFNLLLLKFKNRGLLLWFLSLFCTISHTCDSFFQSITFYGLPLFTHSILNKLPFTINTALTSVHSFSLFLLLNSNK